MRSWKKIVYLLASSACAALLGAACTAGVSDPADTTEPVESAEDAVATPAPAIPVILPRQGRERCEVECHERYERCLILSIDRERIDRERRCERERDHCSRGCLVL